MIMYIYIYIYTSICIYIYICIEREREGERDVEELWVALLVQSYLSNTASFVVCRSHMYFVYMCHTSNTIQVLYACTCMHTYYDYDYYYDIYIHMCICLIRPHLFPTALIVNCGQLNLPHCSPR